MVSLREIQLADGLGGHAFLLLNGQVEDVKSVELGIRRWLIRNASLARWLFRISAREPTSTLPPARLGAVHGQASEEWDCETRQGDWRTCGCSQMSRLEGQFLVIQN